MRHHNNHRFVEIFEKVNKIKLNENSAIIDPDNDDQDYISVPNFMSELKGLDDLVGKGLSHDQIVESLKKLFSEVEFLSYKESVQDMKASSESMDGFLPGEHVKLAPGIHFAYFNDNRDKVVIVIQHGLNVVFNNKEFYKTFKQFLYKMVRHELIHQHQIRTDKKNNRSLAKPNMKSQVDYLSHPHEVQAMARTAADDIIEKELSPAEVSLAIQKLQPIQRLGQSMYNVYTMYPLPLEIRQKFLNYVKVFLKKDGFF